MVGGEIGETRNHAGWTSSGVVLKDLHTLFRVGTAGGLTDGQLLERFLSQRDEAGEAALQGPC